MRKKHNYVSMEFCMFSDDHDHDDYGFIMDSLYVPRILVGRNGLSPRANKELSKAANDFATIGSHAGSSQMVARLVGGNDCVP
jgi:hypothetical protein